MRRGECLGLYPPPLHLSDMDPTASHDPLTTILYRLDAGRQRATYGAVADLLGGSPMFLMNGRPRNPLHSWVVNAQTKLPTRYGTDEMHPHLLKHDHVLTSAEELRAWLDSRARSEADGPEAV